MSIQRFLDFELFSHWAHSRASALAMEAEPCSLADLAPEWIEEKEQGRLQTIAHYLRLFFHIEGVRIVRSAGITIKRWMQPMFFQPSGFVGLVICESEHQEPDVLVRLFAEPGNLGIKVDGVNTRVLAGPPIQFSPGNLVLHQKALRGEVDEKGNAFKPVPFADVALHESVSWAKNAHWEKAVEDGGRFWEKANQYGLITVPYRDAAEEEIENTGKREDFAWVSLPVWRRMRRAEMINGHMRSISSLLV